jgi:hypothetical protein
VDGCHPGSRIATRAGFAALDLEVAAMPGTCALNFVRG